ncbi:Methyltransferase domain-containing protein [Cnuella takakiae]|uniref:Methyltransferase domain-containing protein n=1 Tax=Cnuella takakiae TaxID=1302690 RepID=A0A1M5G6D9_9BACT|nr:methyltransferase domain-containing protein [Cnuella takakiae]OLY92349.1 methyltransferase type 12 [Cnuella takakiae]SHF99357.1 Methyltransferase domain-containing protein [Cnuella takakiae]
MNGTVHYTVCPVCGSKEINPLHAVKDYTVSGKEFVIWQCGQCTLRFTQDVPDAASIGPYYKAEDYISHTDESKGLLTTLYKRVRAYTLGQKADLIKRETGIETGHMLDVGCGTGAFLNAMKTAGWQVSGVEPDSDARNMARKLYGLEVSAPEALAQFAPASFDAITLWHVLEHVHELHPYMEQLKTLLKPNGRIFIAVPNYRSVDADVYRLQWAAYDVPRHLYHFTPKAIETLLQQHGLQLAAQKPMWFDSFYISLLSSKYRNGKKPSWLHAGITGLRSNLTALAQPDRCSSLIYVMEKVK